MQDLLFAFQTVFPLLVYMLVGVFIKKTKMADPKALGQVNTLIFKIFIPMSIFKNIMGADMSGVNMGPILAYAAGMVSLLFLVFWIFYHFWEPDRRKRSVLIQNAIRSNFVLFGLPLSQMILGGVTSGVTEVLIAVIVPLFNVYAVIALQVYGEKKANPLNILKGILTNPMIMSSLFALLVKFTIGPLPDFLMRPVSGMAAISSPLALVILGLRFDFRASARYKKQLFMGVFNRLILTPVLFLGGAILLGFRGEVLVAYLALSASPVAVASYAMAQEMGADDELAGQLLAYNSALCSLTLFFFIFILKTFSLI